VIHHHGVLSIASLASSPPPTTHAPLGSHLEFFLKTTKLSSYKPVTTASQQNNLSSWPSHHQNTAPGQQQLIPDFTLYDEAPAPQQATSLPQPLPQRASVQASTPAQLSHQIILSRTLSAPRLQIPTVRGRYQPHVYRQASGNIVHPANPMDDYDLSNIMNNIDGQALSGASDPSLYVSPDQLNLSYGDFEHSPNDWESTPESYLLSSFSTPLNLNEQIQTGSVDWSNAPLFQTFSTESDLSAAFDGNASRTSSSSSLPRHHPGASPTGGESLHKRTPSAAAKRLIERSAANSKRRKTRDVSPIDLDAIKASGDKKEYKKKKNTEAARKSRAAKAERVQVIEEEMNRLEDESAAKDAEIERLKGILTAHGISS
jgi:hypothetical protein